jgi:hypothetical protein
VNRILLDPIDYLRGYDDGKAALDLMTPVFIAVCVAVRGLWGRG